MIRVCLRDAGSERPEKATRCITLEVEPLGAIEIGVELMHRRLVVDTVHETMLSKHMHADYSDIPSRTVPALISV